MSAKQPQPAASKPKSPPIDLRQIKKAKVDDNSDFSPEYVSKKQESELAFAKEVPLGDLTLVGLSTFTFSLSLSLFQRPQFDFQNNYIEKSLSQFYTSCPKTEKATKLIESTKRLLPKLKDLPQISLQVAFKNKLMIEQIQIKLKENTSFSEKFKIVSVQVEDQKQLLLKSSFSEVATGKDIVELNVCGIAQQLIINLVQVDARPPSSDNDVDDEVALISRQYKADPISHNDINVKMMSSFEIDRLQRERELAELAFQEEDNLAEAVRRGILNDDEEDFRILESLPMCKEKKSTANDEKSQSAMYCSLLSEVIASIVVVGFDFSRIPAITNLTHFMNQSFLLSKHKQSEAAVEVDFLTSVLLITTKRATQAAEVLRKIQCAQVKEIQNNLSKIRAKKGSDQLKVETQTLFIKGALFELMIADALSSTNLLGEKLHALSRMVEFSQGILPSSIRFSEQATAVGLDAYSGILEILPEIVRFCLLAQTHRYEIVQISAFKLIKFILEIQGCSLDQGMVFVLEGMIKTFPQRKKGSGTVLDTPYSDFDLEKLFDDQNTAEGLVLNFSNTELIPSKSWLERRPRVEVETRPQIVTEPNSGFRTALSNIYQHVLDTYISVLSSISSHILHSIFYEVIEAAFVQKDRLSSPDVVIFVCKVAEKIITICQGDLLINSHLLDALIDFFINQKGAEGQDQISLQAFSMQKNMWQSIRTKVFPNYSTRGFRLLVDWLLQQLLRLAETHKESPSELSDERTLLLSQICEAICVIAQGRSRTEEDSNQLIKLPPAESYGGASSAELFLVLPPLLFWIEYAIEREDRFQLFQQLYQTIKVVLASLPTGKVALDVIQIMMPTLQRTSNFLAGNSPSLSMLKFLDIVLSDLQNKFNEKKAPIPSELQYFFLEFLSNFVTYMSYSLYEEVFTVFDKLLFLTKDVLSEQVIRKCIVSLVDKYTLKSKAHKTSLTGFLKSLMEIKLSSPEKPVKDSKLNLSGQDEQDLSAQKHTYFEVMTDFCFFNNFDPTSAENKKVSQNRSVFQSFDQNLSKVAPSFPQLDFRGQQDLHDMFIDKLQFFVDSLALMNDFHINLFTNLITHPSFKPQLLSLLEHDETAIRLKSHEILEHLTAYFTHYCPSKTVYEFADQGTAGQGTHKQKSELMDAEFISHERLFISQIVISVARKSLEQQFSVQSNAINCGDCYLQFNALILLDYLFQNLLPVPTFQNEEVKARGNIKTQNKSSEEMDITIDIEALSISEGTPEVSSFVSPCSSMSWTPTTSRCG